MVDQLNAGSLLIVESTGKKVVVNKNVNTLGLEIFKLIERQILT
jgi:hypothetical protein